MLNNIVFLIKPNGDDRNIGLATTLFRIWQVIRQPYVAEWAAAYKAPWDGTTKGRGALRAAARRSAVAELAVLGCGEG